MSLQQISKAEFRSRLAEVAQSAGTEDRSALKQTSEQIGCLLAKHYNRKELDILKIWHFVEKAFRVGVSRGVDFPTMVSAMLEVVRADSGRVASDEQLLGLLTNAETKPDGWFEDLKAYIRTSIYPIVVYSRKLWGEHKSAMASKKQKEEGDDHD